MYDGKAYSEGSRLQQNDGRWYVCVELLTGAAGAPGDLDTPAQDKARDSTSRSSPMAGGRRSATIKPATAGAVALRPRREQPPIGARHASALIRPGLRPAARADRPAKARDVERTVVRTTPPKTRAHRRDNSDESRACSEPCAGFPIDRVDSVPAAAPNVDEGATGR